jgi:hypothetical protein
MAESDPEYHWSDNFRTSRFSNEARQRTFLQLAGKLRRVVGRKVLEMVTHSLGLALGQGRAHAHHGGARHFGAHTRTHVLEAMC